MQSVHLVCMFVFYYVFRHFSGTFVYLNIKSPGICYIVYKLFAAVFDKGMVPSTSRGPWGFIVQICLQLCNLAQMQIRP